MDDAELVRRLRETDPWDSPSVAAECLAEAAERIAAPTFTAADLERAWRMGRDTLGSRLDHQPIYVRALAPPPADLAQRVKGPAHD